MRGLRLITGAVLVALLTACHSADEKPSLNIEVIDAVRETAAARLQPKQERPPLTRAALDELDGSFMEVVLERRDQLAYLYVSGVTQDPRVGTIVAWRSEDNASLTLRNGVLIATRGIGGDLISTDVHQLPSQIGPVGGGERRMFFLAGDNRSVPVIFACEVTDLGAEAVTIVEHTHRTRHVREHCDGPDGSIENDYWLDSGAGIIWMSRQWGGPEVGYLRFRRITK